MIQILGNVCLALVAAIYFGILPLLVRDMARKSSHDGGALWGSLYVVGPMSFLMTIAMLLATANGGLDWLGWSSALQAWFVLASGAGLAILLFFSLIGHVEPANQLPWATRPFRKWATYVLPVVVVGFTFCSMNEKWFVGLPPWLWRIPLLVTNITSLMVGLGLLVEWYWAYQCRQQQRVEQILRDQRKRDETILSELQGMNSSDHFAEILGFTNRFESDEIRNLAVAKARSHPAFIDAIRQVMNSSQAEKALILIDSGQLTNQELRSLADAFHASIAQIQRLTEAEIEQTHTFYDEQFDWYARLLLSAADAFQSHGVDATQALVAYRQALDTPLTKSVHFDARARLDRWLQKRE